MEMGRIDNTGFFGCTRKYERRLLDRFSQEIKKETFTYGQVENALPSRLCTAVQFDGE